MCLVARGGPFDRSGYPRLINEAIHYPTLVIDGNIDIRFNQRPARHRQRSLDGKKQIVTAPTASRRIAVDSLGWAGYLGSGPKADEFAIYLGSTAVQFLPSIVVYEVSGKLLREQTKQIACLFISRAFAFGDHLIPQALQLSIWPQKQV